MKVFRNAYEAGRGAPRAVVALGKFDGLHRGHRRLLSLARRRAKELKAPLLVVSFDPLPEVFLDRDRTQPLMTREELTARLARRGVQGAVFLPFTRRLICQAPRAFARDVLARALKPAEVCVGADFCFGKDRAGRVEHLESFGAEFGFAVRAAPLLMVGGEKISSARIRALIEEGRTAAAERLLGRKLPKPR